MKRSTLLPLLAALSVVLAPLIVGLIWIKSQVSNAAVEPTLEPVLSLARSKQFGEARKLLAKQLQVFPDNARARLLMARLATDGDQPEPALALENLAKIKEGDPAKRASIAFLEGKAHYQLARYDRAEVAWKEALRLDPVVAEAGTALFNLYEMEGRLAEAYRLGVRLHQVEPDPRDRVRFLLLVARLDLNKPAPESQAKLFAPLVELAPDSIELSTTLGLALIRDSRLDAGIEVLRQSLERHRDSVEAWEGLLNGLDEAGRPEELAKQVQALPTRFADDPRFARYRGQVAANNHDWKAAAAAFRIAYDQDQHDAVVLYRYNRALRQTGDPAESSRVSALLGQYQVASDRLKEVVEKAIERNTSGRKVDVELMRELADLRERMGRPDEALLWHRLVLREDPTDSTSLAAVERLK